MTVNGAELAAWAKQWVGTPYVYGGNSLSGGVDCSGLTREIYKQFGINLPRTSYDQIGQGKAIKMNELQAGDLVFFDTDPDRSGPDHVAIYLGGGKIIHAPRPGKSVEIADMTSGYYQNIFMGGRRVSGMEGGGDAGEWDPSGGSADARLSPEELAASYGWSYGFLNSIPEMKTLFGSFVNETWTKEKFMAEVRNTKWWQENSVTMRQAANEKFSDPATYNAKVSAARIQVTQMAAQMGAAVPEGKLNKIAEDVIRLGLDESGLKNILGLYIDFTSKGTLKGAAGAYEHMIRQFSYAQGVSLDRQTIKNQAELIARGLATVEDFKNQVVNQAVSLYPGYAAQLQAGQTMLDIASPYMEMVAEDLEIPSHRIKLTDPLIKRALNGVDDQGKPVGLDVTQFQKLIRNDPRWRNAQRTQDSVMSTGLKVLQDMGMIGG